jgi:hypothetical protein
MSEEIPSSGPNRSQKRVSHRGKVSLRLLTDSLSAISDNLSSAGILISTEEDLRVCVEIEGPEGSLSRTGRVVRVQRMDSKLTGLAVEFDSE